MVPEKGELGQAARGLAGSVHAQDRAVPLLGSGLVGKLERRAGLSSLPGQLSHT